MLKSSKVKYHQRINVSTNQPTAREGGREEGKGRKERGGREREGEEEYVLNEKVEWYGRNPMGKPTGSYT